MKNKIIFYCKISVFKYLKSFGMSVTAIDKKRYTVIALYTPSVLLKAYTFTYISRGLWKIPEREKCMVFIVG